MIFLQLYINIYTILPMDIKILDSMIAEFQEKINILEKFKKISYEQQIILNKNLKTACQNKDIENIKKNVDEGADNLILCMHICMNNNCVDGIKFLSEYIPIKYKKNIKIPNHFDNKVEKGNEKERNFEEKTEESIDWVFKHGSNLNEEILDALNSETFIETIKYIIKIGEHRGYKFNYSDILLTACDNSDKPIIEFLVNHKLKNDECDRDDILNKAFKRTLNYRSFKLVKLFIENGVKINDLAILNDLYDEFTTDDELNPNEEYKLIKIFNYLFAHNMIQQEWLGKIMIDACKRNCKNLMDIVYKEGMKYNYKFNYKEIYQSVLQMDDIDILYQMYYEYSLSYEVSKEYILKFLKSKI